MRVLCDSLLVSLVKMIDRIPIPPPPPKRTRGRLVTSPDRLILKALVILSIRRWYPAWAWWRCLEQPAPRGPPRRTVLTDTPGRFPSRRPWERRLPRWPPTLPGVIGCLGRLLVQVFTPWAAQGHGAAGDRTARRARGGGWHKKDRAQGVEPHPSLDPEAAWSKSGWHGGWDGWKRPLAVTLGRLWIPLAAEFTPAQEADKVIAPRWLRELPREVRSVLGDPPDHTPARRAEGARHHRERVTTRRGTYPPTEGGVEVRRLFHKLRSQAIEPFNGLFKQVFAWGGQMPVKGLKRCQLFALGAVLLYQWVLLYQHEPHMPLGIEIKPLLRAA